jgi:hypothetical protein
MALRLDQLLTNLVAVLNAVTATPYKQGSLPASFQESPTPFDLAAAGADRSHLNYGLKVLSAVPIAVGTSSSAGNVAGLLRVQVDLDFAYYLRGDNQGVDYRLACRAMGDLVATVVDTPSGWNGSQGSVRCTRRFEPINEPTNGLFESRSSFEFVINEHSA